MARWVRRLPAPGATNRIGAPVANAAAQLAAAVPTARYVRAFNTLGWENFAEPVFDGVPG